MIDKNRFLAKMKENGFTQETLADEAKVSRATISRIVLEGSCSIKSATPIVKALKLTASEAGSIFFASEVS